MTERTGKSMNRSWLSGVIRAMVAGCVLLLVSVLVAGCAPWAGSDIEAGEEAEEASPFQLPDDLSFVWHDLSGSVLDSPVVAVTRATVESYFLSGQAGDLSHGYPGFEEFVDLGPGFPEPSDRHEGTVEFVLVDMSLMEVDDKVEVQASFCYSKYGAARVANGRRYPPSQMMPGGRVQFILDRETADRGVDHAPWNSAAGRQPFLTSNIFETYLGNVPGSRVSISVARGFLDQCFAAVNNKTPVDEDYPPVEPFMPGWPSGEIA